MKLPKLLKGVHLTAQRQAVLDGFIQIACLEKLDRWQRRVIWIVHEPNYQSQNRFRIQRQEKYANNISNLDITIIIRPVYSNDSKPKIHWIPKEAKTGDSSRNFKIYKFDEKGEIITNK